MRNLALFMDDPNWASFIPDLKSGGPKCRMPTHEDCSPIDPDAAARHLQPGGTLGGITTGAAIAFRIAVKPTPSIALPQRSVDLTNLEEYQLEVRGRHDPCVATRAVPIVEAACALAVLDSWLAFPPASQRSDARTR